MTAPSGGLLAVQDRHVFGLLVPWLPDLVGSGVYGHGGDPVGEAYGRQVAMLRALAESGPKGGVLQLRLVVADDAVGDRHSRSVSVYLLGAAPSADTAARLRRHLVTTLPPELAIEPVGPEQLHALLDTDDAQPWTAGSVVEIRRAIESGDPEFDSLDRAQEPTVPVLLRWEWTRLNLLASVGALRMLPPGSQLIVHLEPRQVSADALGWLREEVATHRETVRDDPTASPLLTAAVHGYRQRLRDLPRACLHMRVLLACPEGVPEGLAEVVGADLTRSWEARGSGSAVGTFDLVRPIRGYQLDCALLLVQLLRSEPTAVPTAPELAELMFLFDPHEAGAAFRIPLPGPEGMPGVRSAPVSRLPRGLGVLTAGRDLAVHLGQAASGEALGLSTDEINRHVLVCGLPGFGKTTTVQSVLEQLWRPRDGRPPIPWLVIDPAKADYEPLAERLGQDCRLVEIGAEALAFNPFGVPPGVPRRAFATRVAAAFDAAFNLSEVYPAAATVLARAVHRAFDLAAVPTLPLLYAVVADMISGSAYGDRTRGELAGALLGRLELVADGSMGPALMGDADAVVDWPALLAAPAVVQLRGLTGPRERALVLALLLAGLVSYRERTPVRGLGHVTVVEEAHRVLGRGSGNDGSSEGAKVFVDAMAELRAAGEGVIVVEQAPSRLAPDVVKLVGTVVAHRLVDAQERAQVAATVLLQDGDSDLARLRTGQAVVLAADMLAPTLVQIDPAPRDEDDDAAEDGSGPFLARRADSRLAADGLPMTLWCQDCPVACRGRDGLRAVPQLRAALNGGPAAADPVLRTARAVLDGHAPDAYCASAFVLAHASPDRHTWDGHRRKLKALYARQTRPRPPAKQGETA